MTERSRFWDGSVTGDAVSITDDEFMGRFFRSLWNGTGDQGVLRGWLNELEVTDGGVDTATVDTGGSILYGIFHENDAALNVDIAAYRGGNCLIIVRASWATQTARIVARAVGALTQTAGVTYEIPLANVAIDGAGAITLITDTRDYCEYSTELLSDVVESAHIQADAVTTAKLENQTRNVLREAGELEADVTNPATWAHNTTVVPYNCYWEFDNAALNTVWATYRVPPDVTGAAMTVYIWLLVNAVTDEFWGYSAWKAQPSAVLANQANTQVITETAGWDTIQRESIGTLTVAAGDILTIEIYRNGGHASDTSVTDSRLLAVEFEYTADS